jgi:anti-anti-sigma factor
VSDIPVPSSSPGVRDEWAMLTAPVEIDMTNAPMVREALLGALGRGVSAVVMDMTATTFCDCAAVRVLVEAHKLAAARGIELRLAMGGAAVRRVLSLLEADRLLAVYPDRAAALATHPGLGRAAPGMPASDGQGNL